MPTTVSWSWCLTHDKYVKVVKGDQQGHKRADCSVIPYDRQDLQPGMLMPYRSPKGNTQFWPKCQSGKSPSCYEFLDVDKDAIIPRFCPPCLVRLNPDVKRSGFEA